MHHQNYYALLIGASIYDSGEFVNCHYTETDCENMKKVLSSNISFFPEENITQILRENVTTKKIKESLFSLAYDRKPDDTVLIYYSGHGFRAGRSNSTYLATYDVKKAYLDKNPDDGISMQFLRERIREIKVKNLILIIDSCYSGSFLFEEDSNEIIKNRIGQENKTNVIGFLSSTNKTLSFPDTELNQSEFTKQLIVAINGGKNGETVDEENGEVNHSLICMYLDRKYGDSVKSIQADNFTYSKPNFRLPKRNDYPNDKNTSLHQIQPLKNHGDIVLSFIHSLEERINIGYLETLDEKLIKNHLFDIVMDIYNAGFVSYFNYPDRILYERDNVNRYNQQGWKKSVHECINLINDEYDLFTLKVHGYQIQNDTEGNVNLIIPLDRYFNDFLILIDIKTDEYFLEEDIALVIKCLYRSVSKYVKNKLFTRSISLFSIVLDEYKSTYGNVSPLVYDYRYNAFLKELERIEFWFQPIVRLNENPRWVQLVGYEALARDPESELVPTELLSAADLWGDDFQLLFDLHCSAKAITTYSDLTLPSKSGDSSINNQPLSINAYPSTLANEKYFYQLRRLIKSGKFVGTDLVIEISEKKPIPNQTQYIDLKDLYKEYTAILQRYVNKLGIGFAIDDFGVEHSSIPRISNLTLNHIKIDSCIPIQNQSQITMKYVVNLANDKMLKASKVILEGVSDINMIQEYGLADLGISYIQGYSVGKAQPTLFILTEEMKENLSAAYLMGKSVE